MNGTVPNRAPRSALVLAGVLSVLLLGLPTAAASDAAGRLDQRTIAVPETSVVISLWDQLADDGTTQPYYAIALDGRHFSRPVATSYDVLVSYQEFDPAEGTPSVPAFLAAGVDTSVHIVQFVVQPLPAFQQQIETLGGTIDRFMPSNGLVVTMAPAVRDQVAALPHVRWVGPYEPAYRLEPEVLMQLFEPGLDGQAERYAIEVMQRGAEQQEIVAGLIASLGGTVHSITPEGFRMEATMTRAALLEVARTDQVNFIDRWGGPAQYDMNIARRSNGSDADFIKNTLGFNGEGVKGEVIDGGVLKQHVAFADIQLHNLNGSIKDHGTSTYGIIYGNGTSNPSGKGMLPGQPMGIFAYSGQLAEFGGWRTRYEHTVELVDPALSFHAVFQSSSVGSNRTTSYTTISAQSDDVLFMYDLLSCQSQSNAGDQMSRPQAWAKNIVSVGGMYHFNNLSRGDDRWNSGASTGPASDGRIKPDLAHFYDEILCPTDTSTTAYTYYFGGTSAATPITAGAFGILFQMWHEGTWAGFGGGTDVFDSRPHMATAKALMINAAYRYAMPGEYGYTDLTRTRQGWGMANLKNLYDQAAKAFIIDESEVLMPLETHSYRVEVAAGEPQFKATLVYTDPKGNPSVQSQHRVNDLTLKVTAPDSTVYYGNYGLSSKSWSTAGGTPDTKNTVENVFVQNPSAGMWTVEIIGSEIVQDGHPETAGVVDADYALVVCGVTYLAFPVGDLNCDGLVDFGDINPFVLALTNPAGYATAYPDCDRMLADIDQNGIVDFGDINPFVNLLTGGE